MAITVVEKDGVKLMSHGVYNVRQEFGKTKIYSETWEGDTFNTDLLETAVLCVLDNPGSIVGAINAFHSVCPNFPKHEARYYVKAAMIYKRFI